MRALHMIPARFLVMACVAVAILVSGGCRDRAEVGYGEAAGDLSETQLEVRRRQDALASAETAARRARDRVEAERQALIRAKEELARAERRLADAATDAVLFRTIQRQLLEDRRLRGTAVSVRVEAAVVTLSGRVDDAAVREHAGLVVAKAPGVKMVNNRVVVAAPSAGSG